MPKLNLYSPILELKSKLVSVSKTPLIDLNAEIALSNPSKLLDVISAAKSHLPFVVYRPVISGSLINWSGEKDPVDDDDWHADCESTPCIGRIRIGGFDTNVEIN